MTYFRFASPTQPCFTEKWMTAHLSTPKLAPAVFLDTVAWAHPHTEVILKYLPALPVFQQQAVKYRRRPSNIVKLA